VLLDGHQWELVSPPDKQGSLIQAIRETTAIEAAAAGNAIPYPNRLADRSSTAGYTKLRAGALESQRGRVELAGSRDQERKGEGLIAGSG
jgi:hypothetical protein